MPTSTHSDTRIDSIDERQKKRSVKFTLRFDKTVQNVGSRERMLGLEVGGKQAPDGRPAPDRGAPRRCLRRD